MTMDSFAAEQLLEGKRCRCLRIKKLILVLITVLQWLDAHIKHQKTGFIFQDNHPLTEFRHSRGQPIQSAIPNLLSIIMISVLNTPSSPSIIGSLGYVKTTLHTICNAIALSTFCV